MTNHDVSIGELAKQNPWWKNREFPPDDPEKGRYEKSSFKWNPRLLKRLEEKDVIYTLRGPRRVGKTTSLKIKIEQCLSEGVLPRNIFYFSCDRLYNPPFQNEKDLANVLETYLRFRKADERAFIFIDEITQVKDWQPRIQPLIREGKFRNCTVVFTGNHCIDVRKRPNLLVGLRGEQLLKHRDANLVLLQPKFVEYVETRDETIGREIEKLNLHGGNKRKEVFLNLANHVIPPEVEENLSLYVPELNDLLADYLITGGNCQATHEYVSTGTISKNIYDTFVRLITNDICEWECSQPYAKQTLSRIIETIAWPVTWSGLIEGTSIKNHKTSRSYTEMFIDTFAVNCHYKWKRGKKRSEPHYASPDKKIYIRDPFIFHACHAWIMGKDDPFALSLEFLGDNRGRLVESVFSDHLTRLAFKLNFETPGSFKPHDHVFFYRTKGNNEKGETEVDFVVRIDNKFLAVESKYSDNKPNNLRAMKEFMRNAPDAYPCGIVTSKTILDDSNDKCVIIPASILLLLI